MDAEITHSDQAEFGMRESRLLLPIQFGSHSMERPFSYNEAKPILLADLRHMLRLASFGCQKIGWQS